MSPQTWCTFAIIAVFTDLWTGNILACKHCLGKIKTDLKALINPLPLKHILLYVKLL